jgi:chemotaxis signal transduction protein
MSVSRVAIAGVQIPTTARNANGDASRGLNRADRRWIETTGKKMARSELQPDEKYCIVRKGNSWFAIPALSVREITSSDSAIPVPRSHPVLAGLCQLRNEFLPVLRLFDRTEQEPSAPKRDTPLLVITGLSGTWAFEVDEIAGLASLDVSVDADTRSSDGWLAAVMGSATYRDKVVRLLDANRLYRLAERELRGAWGEGSEGLETAGTTTWSQGESS